MMLPVTSHATCTHPVTTVQLTTVCGVVIYTSALSPSATLPHILMASVWSGRHTGKNVQVKFIFIYCSMV